MRKKMSSLPRGRTDFLRGSRNSPPLAKARTAFPPPRQRRGSKKVKKESCAFLPHFGRKAKRNFSLPPAS